MPLTYQFDNTGPLADFDDILGRYGTDFSTSLESAVPSLPDTEGNAGNVSLQVLDTGGETFDASSFEGAYVTDTASVPDAAPIVVFGEEAAAGGGIGVNVALNGNVDQFIGLTSEDDTLAIKASGNDGDLVIDAGDGDDTVTSGRGDDAIYGGNGYDLIRGGAGNDWIDGGDGDDKLFGGQGDDGVIGGSGDDSLYGGTGDNMLDGGEGDDVFQLNAGRNTSNIVDGGDGFDEAYIFGRAGGDFTFDGTSWSNGEGTSFTNVEYADVGRDLLITAGSEGEATVAALFQVLTDHDPSADELRDAFAFMGDEDNTASDFAQLLDDSTGEAVSGTDDIRSYVDDLFDNAFDHSHGEGVPDSAWLDTYVNTLVEAGGETLVKADIAADFASQAVVEEHLHIAVAGATEVMA
ncbi:calcium-binding protein [Alsobacter sp. R-9]